MKFVRKSILRKLFLKLFLFIVLISGISYYVYFLNDKEVPFYLLIGSLFFFLLLFVSSYWFDVLKPLKLILYQVQALLSGDSYKRIYSTRIDEFGVFAHFFNKVTKGFGELSYEIKDRKRILDELTIASQLQRDILPLENPHIIGLEVVAKNRPASELGGDSFDIITVGNKTYFYIGDVTGHGAAAGLIMTMVSSLVEVFSESCDSAYEILVNVNKHIKRHVKKAMYMTLVMLCWDHEKQKLTYVGAGHEHILVYRVNTGQCDVILSGGGALGMVPDKSKLISEKEIELEEGDFIVLYTDGITEARNKAGELFGLDRLKALLMDYAPRYSSEGVNYHIAKDVSSYMKEHGQDDDMTLMVLRKNLSNVKSKEIKITDTNWKE